MVFCIICRNHVCREKAAFYTDPYNKMCNECREKEISRIIKGAKKDG